MAERKRAPVLRKASRAQDATPPVAKSVEDLESLFLRKLEESGLSREDVDFEPMSAEQCAELGLATVAAGFKIPYHGVDGKKTGFFRFRYLEDTRTSFEKAAGAKQRRYGQVKDTLNEFFFPTARKWGEIALDTSLDLWITEGELKATAACFGQPTIGLGGVWCWRSSKAGLTALPDFDAIVWKTRKVFVCFDSDAATNKAVQDAEVALCRELVDRGARAFIVRLPPLGDGRKCGIDDWLVSQGHKRERWVEDMEALKPDASEFATSAALHEFNDEAVYVRDPGMVVTFKNWQKMLPQAFTAHHFANRFFTARDADGKPRKLPLAKAWLTWPMRGEVDKITYAPGQDLRITDESGRVLLNGWKGWGCSPKEGDISPWTELLDYIFRGQADARKWFEQWLAYPIQHPGAKLFSAAVMWGATQGTGKSLIGYTMARVYGQNFIEIQNSDLGSGFNAWVENKQFVMGEEITGGEGLNARRVADVIKGLITQQKVFVNSKYQPQYETPAVANFYFTTNHPDAFHLEDTDRRYFVHEMPRVPLSAAWFRKYDRWYKSEEGAQAMFHHLLNVDLEGFNPHGHALDTAAKRQMTSDGMSDLALWVRALMADPEHTLQVNGVAPSHRLYTPRQLLAFYDPEGRGRVGVNGVAREMRRAGVRYLGSWQTGHGLQQLYDVRATGEPDTFEDWGKVYDKERGLSAKKPAAKKGGKGAKF